MLAVKGVCTLCKEELSIFRAGLVCFNCEKFVHGSCCKPPQDMSALQKYVIAYSSWYCEKCYNRYSKDITSRGNADRIVVEKKMDLLNQIRDLIMKIEDTLRSMGQRCKQMNDRAISLTMENEELKKQILLHEKFLKDKPKNFKQWKERRKILGVAKREKRAIKYWLPLDVDGPSKRKELLTFIKKQQGLSEKEANKAVYTSTRKKEKLFKHKAPDSSISFQIYQTINNISKSRLANVFLIAVIVIYTLLGALVYTYVEGAYESDLRDQIVNERNRLIRDGNQTVDEVRHYFDFLSEIFGNHSKVLTRGDEELAWDYIDSIYFCGMTYTSVGYGDITPMTSVGKVFTIIYAFFGIPMFLMLLASLGSYVCKGILFDISLMTRCCLKMCCKDSRIVKRLNDVEDYDDETKAIVDQGCGVLLYFIVTLIVTFLVGAVLFMFGENLQFMPALYFIFITLSTLGFGDTVPNNRAFMIASVVYIVVGLTMASTAINAIMYVLKEKLSSGFHKLGKKVDEMETGVYTEDYDA
ncbi:TWiK family of potassium channels protein 18-like [Cimex lectularius]|uniref:PHD-type domain-containing protein n=1 Tax=Cimex lectularius TaxID=79782 RepID=A0A8I6RBX6_CIMLE|nr:TWiK family of potassium channels protein 18-like [Cimex lectularius]